MADNNKLSQKIDEKIIFGLEWLAEQMPGGFFIYSADKSQEILYVNEATCRMFGCDTVSEFKELTGYTFRGMVHPEDFDGIQTSIEEQIADPINHNMDYVVYRIVRKDGAVRWVDDYGHFANMPGYGDVFYVFIGDITEKRMAQEEQERSRVLAIALKEAERANVAKTAFLSNMSHEIRTPMNAIIGLDNIALKNPELSDETREQLTKIGASARHLLSLINDILDMSRIESGRMSIKNEEFNFGDMLEQINTMIGSQCDDKGLQYNCTINGHLDDFYIGDEMKLKQVIINILGNAVKFTPEPGSIDFIVEVVESDSKKSTLRFVMRDTGVGMDKAFVPRIFDAFSMENEGMGNKYGSSGLGMAITKNIVDMMNSTITVWSEKGTGSEFTLCVPLGRVEKKTEGDEGLNPENIHALIIDDDITACEHAQLILNRIGVSSDYSLSGKEALVRFENALARQKPYNLILMDWKMPEMDGIEATKRFREKFADEDFSIILTTYNWDEIMEEALAAGVAGFMSKPFFKKSILSQIQTIMTSSGTGQAKKKVSLAGKRILLAEDMTINAEIMKQLLRMKDMEMDHAENGELVVDMFKESAENTYAAILMDIRMPILNGLEATAAIRALDRDDAKKIPIIAMTANAFDEDVRLSLDAGMNAHLSKPVEPDALFATLEKIITEE